MDLIELLGIAAGLFIFASFLFKNLVVIRMVNMIGCATFAVYGGIIGAWSVLGINGALCLMQVVFIILHFVKKKKAGNKSAAVPAEDKKEQSNGKSA